MAGRRYRVDEVAPLFRGQAKTLYVEKGYKVEKIWEQFCEEYGDGQCSRSSFYRWWDDVYSEYKLDEETRTKALAVLEKYEPGDERISRATFSIAQQQVVELLHVCRGEWDVNDLRKLLSTLDRVRRTDLELEMYQQNVKEQLKQASDEADKKLKEAGVKPDTRKVVRDLYGLVA